MFIGYEVYDEIFEVSIPEVSLYLCINFACHTAITAQLKGTIAEEGVFPPPIALLCKLILECPSSLGFLDLLLHSFPSALCT